MRKMSVGKNRDDDENNNRGDAAVKIGVTKIRPGVARGDGDFGSVICFQGVFADEIFFVESKEARDGANKSAAKNAAGQFFPVAALESFEKGNADARGGGDFLQRDAAQFALAPEMVAEIGSGHGKRAATAL